MINLTFIGEPVSKARPRVTRYGGAYNPQSKIEAAVKWEARQQYDGPPLEGPIRIELWCCFKRPKAHYGTGRNASKLKQSAPVHCTNSKDLDNILKFYGDMLNGIVYVDDRQIIGATISKQWTDGAGAVLVSITEEKT